MWKVRYYVPLIGFVVPTLVIGYGFVIPSVDARGRRASAARDILSWRFATGR